MFLAWREVVAHTQNTCIILILECVVFLFCVCIIDYLFSLLACVYWLHLMSLNVHHIRNKLHCPHLFSLSLSFAWGRRNCVVRWSSRARPAQIAQWSVAGRALDIQRSSHQSKSSSDLSLVWRLSWALVHQCLCTFCALRWWCTGRPAQIIIPYAFL